MQAGAHVYDHYSINTIARISQIFIHASRRFKSVAGSQRELRGRRGCITYPHKGKRPSVRPFTKICPLRLDLKYPISSIKEAFNCATTIGSHGSRDNAFLGHGIRDSYKKLSRDTGLKGRQDG